MRISSLLLAASLLISGSSATKLYGAEPVPTGLSVSISFAPASANPNAYSCTAEITDLATGTTLAKPNVLGIKGESAKVQTGDDNSSLVLDVMVNKAGTNGTYTVIYSKSGKVVSIQKGSISIQ